MVAGSRTLSSWTIATWRSTSRAAAWRCSPPAARRHHQRRAGRRGGVWDARCTVSGTSCQGHESGPVLAVFSACSHAGITNVVQDATTASGLCGEVLQPCYASYLAKLKLPLVTFSSSTATHPPVLASGGMHCTPWRAACTWSARRTRRASHRLKVT